MGPPVAGVVPGIPILVENLPRAAADVVNRWDVHLNSLSSTQAATFFWLCSHDSDTLCEDSPRAMIDRISRDTLATAFHHTVVMKVVLFFSFMIGALHAETVCTSTILIAKKNKRETLLVHVTRHQGTEGLEHVVLEFAHIVNGREEHIEAVELGPSFIDRTSIRSGEFLKNGRKQIFAFIEHGYPEGQVFDFNGNHLASVYNSDNYNGPRIWTECIHKGDTDYIFEQWTADFFSEPGFSIHIRRDNIVLRVMKWENREWKPVKFKRVGKRIEILG